jgi:predicted membrane metal-binding protein
MGRRHATARRGGAGTWPPRGAAHDTAARFAGGGLGTTPYAAFHFHRVTPYGVLANLAAMPVVRR